VDTVVDHTVVQPDLVMEEDMVLEDPLAGVKAAAPLRGRASSAQLQQHHLTQSQTPSPTVVEVTNGPTEAKFRVEGPTVALSPQLPQASQVNPSSKLEDKILLVEKGWGNTPLFKRLQKSLPFWERYASKEVLQIIKEGIKPPWSSPPKMSTHNHPRGDQNLERAADILQDYQNSGSVRLVNPTESCHLIPWFLISKPEEGGGVKWRLISDCRELNQFFTPKPFKLDHLQQILPNLQQGSWGAKIDLKDAYFHVPVHTDLKPFLRHQVGNQIWEYQCGLFGLNIMPEVFMKLMKTFQKKWRQKGIQVYIYLDDILLVAPTQNLLQKHLQLVVGDLLESGFKLNLKKCKLQPSQLVEHLGFQLNFQLGKLQMPPQKVKGLKKQLGKFVKKSEMSKRQVAAILGQIRSNLVAMPFLRAFTGLLVQFLANTSSHPWDSKHLIPRTIKDQLKEIKILLENWSGRNFPQNPSRFLHSDSSTHGWGGVDVHHGNFIQEYWRDLTPLHINKKELIAAINTVQSLSKEGETVSLSVDNQVIYYYLTKGGGRKNPFNEMLQPFYKWLMEKGITLQVNWVPSEKCLADPISRWEIDRGDYTLDPELFQKIQNHFRNFIHLKTDLFASPGNKKLDQFVSRWAHWEATAVDALQCPLDGLGDLYANPPWSVISKLLPRLRQFPSAKVLMVLPYWDSATWWPQLIKMKVPKTPCLRVTPYRGMFKNCWGEVMPPPKWDLLCIICSGKFWRGDKFKLQPLKISLQNITA
jgi:hypothetical protein